MTKKKSIRLMQLLIILLMMSTTGFCQEQKDYSLARVGNCVDGVYIFLRSTPYHEFEIVGTTRITLNLLGNLNETFEQKFVKELTRKIDLARKKYPYFNGIVFQDSSYNNAVLIKFVGLEEKKDIQKFNVGSKVTFELGPPLSRIRCYGEVKDVISHPGMATIEYLNAYGEQESASLEYSELTFLTEQEYKEQYNSFLEEIQKHQFVKGEKVKWINSNGQEMEGKVTELYDKTHKATVEYLNDKNKRETRKIDYLALTKEE